MNWIGTWRNQYGSVVTITSATEGRLGGTFRTAIKSSPFFGADVDIAGVYAGVTICFSSAVGVRDGYVVSYTGKLENDRLEKMWFVVAGEQDWWASVTTNHDTFERVE
jgi:hypothetical protein